MCRFINCIIKIWTLSDLLYFYKFGPRGRFSRSVVSELEQVETLGGALSSFQARRW